MSSVWTSATEPKARLASMKRTISASIWSAWEPEFETQLNAVGKDGWELVASFDRERGGNSKECYFIFKRPLDWLAEVQSAPARPAAPAGVLAAARELL
jgi:hypothetical protein